MASRILFKKHTDGKAKTSERDESGVALMMVMSTMTILALLVKEFVFVAQINQKMVYDALDQMQAYYTAKSAVKISLLRLKAYKALSGLGKGDNENSPFGNITVPKSVLENVWSIPIVYPIDPNLPGLTIPQKTAIEEFQKESGIIGNFNASISSEGSKFNLNTALSVYVPKASPTPTSTSGTTPAATASPVSFSPDEARKVMTDYFYEIYKSKTESDPEFQKEYRDFRVEDLMDSIFAWSDRKYESRNWAADYPPKKAPFYSVSELHLLPQMDDTLYALFSPNLSALTSPGVNVNTIDTRQLQALIPSMTEEERSDFFKFRDDSEKDNLFKKPEDFFKYLKDRVGTFRGSDQSITDLKNRFQASNIRLVTEETYFKITARAFVNQSSKTIEAWITFEDKKEGDNLGTNPDPQAGLPNATNVTSGKKRSSGLKMLSMRIL